MSGPARTLRPSQIADLLSWLTLAPFHGEIVRCWQLRVQAQAEWWADFTIHRLVIRDLDVWKTGRPRRIPRVAEHFIIQKHAEINWRKRCQTASTSSTEKKNWLRVNGL